jgi:hypothetical protein
LAILRISLRTAHLWDKRDLVFDRWHEKKPATLHLNLVLERSLFLWQSMFFSYRKEASVPEVARVPEEAHVPEVAATHAHLLSTGIPSLMSFSSFPRLLFNTACMI